MKNIMEIIDGDIDNVVNLDMRELLLPETMLHIFYPRTQIGFHVEPDPDIRRSTCLPFQLCTSKDSSVDSLAINSLFNDVTIENITPITTKYQVV